ncbi:MAG: acyl-CoA thioesterase, partial [Flavitalea sp.]
CDYKRSLRYGDRVLVESRFLPCEAAKLIFEYTLFNVKTNELVAKGSSLQVFLDKETSSLQLINPPFFREWKKQHGLI